MLWYNRSQKKVLRINRQLKSGHDLRCSDLFKKIVLFLLLLFKWNRINKKMIEEKTLFKVEIENKL